jgi:hypothetical protein
MTELVTIRIDYFNDIETTEAVPLGPFPGGSGELFRVLRPSICVAGIAREDVVRLEPDGDRYVFFGVIERSSWNTHWLLLPRDANQPAEPYAVFRRDLEAQGCIVEGERAEEHGLRVVISVPAGVPDERWKPVYEHLIKRSSGLTPDAFVARVADEVQRAERARRVELERADRRERRRGWIVWFAPKVVLATYGVVLAALLGWWIRVLGTSTVHARPRVALAGAVVAMLPGVLTATLWRSFKRAAIGAVTLTGLVYLLAIAPGNATLAGPAATLGFLSALVLGGLAVFLAVLALFMKSERVFTYCLVVIPTAIAAIGALVYAITAPRA